MTDYRDELWERVAAYAEDELDDVERKAFEERLNADPALQEALQAWNGAVREAKDWFDAPPPGMDRLSQLPIPTMRETQSRSTGWKRLAAAALFVMGFGLGVLAQRDMNLLNNAIEPEPTPIQQAPISSEPTPITKTESEKRTVPSENQTIAQLDEPTFTQQEDGRLIIETTLHGSGARAVWIVDGGFRLPKTKNLP